MILQVLPVGMRGISYPYITGLGLRRIRCLSAMNFKNYLLWIGHKIGASYTMKVDVWKITQGFSAPNDADKLINEACHFLLPVNLYKLQIEDLKEILLPGGIPDYNWTDEYNAAVTPSYPNHATARQSVALKLGYLYKRIMNLSEYQLS